MLGEEIEMSPDEVYARYEELQGYVGWTAADAGRVRALAERMEPHFSALIDDFYAEIERHPNARKVITGGREQIERLKGTLRGWLHELFSGQYDAEYVGRRWRVGYRHVEIGLDQVYTNVALSRLRSGLVRAVQEYWPGELGEIRETIRSLNKLLDLDLAIIQEAYQDEYSARQQRTERMATLGQVAGGVAHELRNPLNVVKTSVYYLLNARSPSSEKTAEHLGRIERQVTLADGVITTLSSFAKMPLPSLRPFSLADCVRQSVETNPLPENVEVSIDCPPSLPQALGDIDQIRIVFSNLIRNARDAMPEGGRLSIIGRVCDDKLELAVADTGVGIPPENLSRIMEPLFSTKARGLGLGLAIARSILDKNKATLRVASEPRRGTTFAVQLSVATE
jgi:signal transduction histidine kinase